MAGTSATQRPRFQLQSEPVARMGEGADKSSTPGSIVNEVFALAWQIARGGLPNSVAVSNSNSIDQPFWMRVRLLAEQCESDTDWRRLRAVLLGISLDPRSDTTPLFAFSLTSDTVSNARQQLSRHSRRSRKRASAAKDEQTNGLGKRYSTVKESEAERTRLRKRLRELLDGAPERSPDETRSLMRWVLDDAESVDAARREETQVLGEELTEATRRLLAAAARREDRAKSDGSPDAMRKLLPEVVHAAASEDVLRSGAGGAAFGVSSRVATPVPIPAPVPVEPSEDLLRMVDEAAAALDLPKLADLLLCASEDVAVKAALTIAAICARDEALQRALSATPAIERIVGLLGAPFSEQGLLDLTEVLKALCANQMHHPRLLEQFVAARGPKQLLLGLNSGPASGVAKSAAARQRALLEIIRSLSGAEAPRRAFVKEGALPRLCRMLGAAVSPQLAEPSAGALAVMSKHAGSADAMLKSQAFPALVQALARGAGSPAAVSAASAIGSLARLGPHAQKAARDAGALEGLMPLLDGAFAGNGAEASAAESAARALVELLSGPAANRSAAQLRELGGLQTLVGSLGVPAVSVALRCATLEAIDAAVNADVSICNEISRLGGASLIVPLTRDKSKKVSALASTLVTTLSAKGSAPLLKALNEAVGSVGDLPSIVNSLEPPDTSEAEQAALMLDTTARQNPQCRATLLELGAISRLVNMLRPEAQVSDNGKMNALGALDTLSAGDTAVQSVAREEGVLQLLPQLLDMSNPVELRCNAVLAAMSLMHGNGASIDEAREVAFAAALLQQLDEGAASEVAVLSVAALKEMGLSSIDEQEKLIHRLHATLTDQDRSITKQRAGALKAIWALEAIASPISSPGKSRRFASNSGPRTPGSRLAQLQMSVS